MKTQNCTSTIETPTSAAARTLARLDRRLPAPTAVLQAMWRTLICWQRRANDRRQLAEMEDHLLQDMGISRADAQAESWKPFWRR